MNENKVMSRFLQQQGNGNHLPNALHLSSDRQNEDVPELITRRFVRMILRNWWVFALSVILFGGATVSYYAFLTPKYCAESLIEMSVRRPRIMNQKAAVTDDTDLNTMLQMQVAEIFNTRLEKLKGKKIRELTVGRIKTQAQQSAPTQDGIDAILDNVKSSLIRRTCLIKISYKHENPLFACQVANAFAESVVQYSQEENRADSENAVAWLEQQVAKQGQTLGKIKQKIMNLHETNHWAALTNEWSDLRTALTDTSRQLTQLENAQILTQEILQAIRKIAANPQSVGNLPDSTPRREELMACISKWMVALQERDNLLSKYTAEHPAVVAASKTIEMHKTLVATAIERAQSTAEANLQLQQQQTDGLRRQMERLTSSIIETDKKLIRLQTEFSPYERELTAAEMCYTGLLTRIEEARLSTDENTTVVKIIELATPPTNPHNPYKLLVLILGVLLGLAGGLGIAFLIDITEDRFLGTDDLEHTLKLRVLGIVPRLNNKARAEIGQIIGKDRNGHMAEAYAGIRAAITAAASNRQATCLLVTSASPGEGKTITATNIAIAFAQSKVKTLLVDFDLRRPQIESIFSIPKSEANFIEILDQGLVENFPKLPIPSPYMYLSVISNHASRKYCVAEIMGCPIIRKFITWAQEQYEMVIFDSPPFGVVSDALVLAKMVDGVVFVHRPGISRRHALHGLVRQFDDAGAPLMGVVVNGVVRSRFFALSNYDYRYGGGDYTYDYPADGKLQ